MLVGGGVSNSVWWCGWWWWVVSRKLVVPGCGLYGGVGWWVVIMGGVRWWGGGMVVPWCGYSLLNIKIWVNIVCCFVPKIDQLWSKLAKRAGKVRR